MGPLPTMLLAAVVVVAIAITGVSCGPLLNTGFEEPVGWDNWWCGGCVGELVPEPHTGNYSYLVSQKVNWWAGPRQSKVLENGGAVGSTYLVSAYIKLLPTEAVPHPTDEPVYLTGWYKYSDDTKMSVRIVEFKGISYLDGWVRIASDYTIPDLKPELTLVELTIYMEGPQTGVNYLVDDFTMDPINLDTNWRPAAEQMIEENRYRNLTINVRAWSGHGGYEDATVELQQVEGEFGFGSSADAFLLSSDVKYRDTFLRNFDWAVLDYDMSWVRTEFSKNRLTWEDADAGMAVLEQHGKRVRGPTIHSADQSVMPNFARDLESPEDIYRSSMKRVDDLVGRYRYRCEDWDVFADMFSERYNRLVDVFGSKTIIYDLFKRAKEVDYAANLYFNDVDIIRSSTFTYAAVNMVNELRRYGSPIDGISATGKFEDAPDMPSVVFRLDALAEARVPVWISSYSFIGTDEAARVQALDDILTAALSQPTVDGVMLAGFWDKHHPDGADAALFDTDEFGDIAPNAVGRKWQEFYERFTKYREVVDTFTSVANDNFTYERRLPTGVYNVIIRRSDGHVVKNVRVSVLKHHADKEVTIWI